MKKFTIAILFLGLLVLSEPNVRSKFTFAVTYLNEGQLFFEKIGGANADQAIIENGAYAHRETGHAPEPSTLILMLGGFAGIIVRLVRRSFEKFKRYMDLSLAILGLTVTSPVLLFSAMLIKLTSPGPILYKQTRLGKGSKLFDVYKLRTMRFDAETGTGAVWAKKNDPRITSVGRILRKSRIDEIPQLFNVIEGDMSIVGPRPERPEMVRSLKELICDYEKRLLVKPGITGLAQTLHKYDETIADVRKKVKYDLLYIKKMCLLTDLSIMGQTFVVVFTGKGAH